MSSPSKRPSKKSAKAPVRRRAKSKGASGRDAPMNPARARGSQACPDSNKLVITEIMRLLAEGKKDIYEQIDEAHPNDERRRALCFLYINELNKIPGLGRKESRDYTWDDLWEKLHDKWPGLAPKTVEDAIIKASEAGLIHTQPQKIIHEEREISLADWFEIPRPMRPIVYFHPVTRSTATRSAGSSPLEPHGNSHVPTTTNMQAPLGNNITIDTTADSRDATSKQTRSYGIADLRKMTGLKNTSINKYAKLAGVSTAGRGKRDFRYPLPDVRLILEKIVNETSEAATRERCQMALSDLPGIAAKS